MGGALALARRLLALPWLRRLVGIALFAGSLVFLGRTLAGLDPLARLALLDGAAMALLPVLTLLYAAALLLLALAWGVLADPGGRVSTPGLVAIYGRSVLAKYLPGGVMHYGSRQWSGGAAGLAQGAMARASGIEIALHLLLSALVALAGAGLGGLLFPASAFVALAAAALLALFASGRTSRAFISAAALQGLFFWAFWIIAFGTAWAVTRSASSAATLATIFLVGWLAGFVLPFVPGGIGVREAVIVALGAGHADSATLLSFAALTRLVTLGGDVWIGLLGYALRLPVASEKRQASASQ